MSAVLDDFAELVVQRLDAVGRVDDSAQHRRESQEWGDRSHASWKVRTDVGYHPPRM
ncbi:MAG: hypothetical protein JWM76_2143, partial [Pseudonocardiales bacterium]|nr:hypothetical protein [Pseudonocardiales bacterium]